MHCPSCGARNNDTDLVCMRCGALLSVSPDELERVELYRLSQNRELLTIIFIDVSGFTGISNRSMASSQKILAIHTALVTAIVEREKAGEVVNTAGDGILAVFSNPAVAVERALEMQVAVAQYHQGRLTEENLVNALKDAGLAPHPSSDDEEYQIHIGMNLGLVTRGGHTSRDIFGHNVNVTCRLCSMAGKGQVYMTEAVYDNARLILGERTDLTWQTWKELPIRGLDTPLSVVAVAQQPYTEITPPRMRIFNPRELLLKRNAAILAISILGALIVGILGGLALKNVRQHDRRPFVAVFHPGKNESDPLITTTQLPNEPSNTTATADNTTLPTTTPPVDGSATNTTVTPPGTGELPPPDGTTPDPPDGTPPDTTSPATNNVGVPSPDIAQFKLESIKDGTPLNLTGGAEKVAAKLLAFTGKDGLLLAIGIEGQINAVAEMAVVIDGDADGKLQSQDTAPFTDVMLRATGPGAAKSDFHLLALADGKPGADLTPPDGLVAATRTADNWSIWLFRLPYSTLGKTPPKNVNFRLLYWPEGLEKAVLSHPAQQGNMRQLIIPD